MKYITRCHSFWQLNKENFKEFKIQKLKKFFISRLFTTFQNGRGKCWSWMESVTFYSMMVNLHNLIWYFYQIWEGGLMEGGHMKLSFWISTEHEYKKRRETWKDIKKTPNRDKIIKSKKCVRRTFEIIIQELITRLKL